MFKKTASWAAAMGWHLWQIATLRPAFHRLSDSRAMLGSFIGVFFAAGILRWTLMGPGGAQYQLLPTMVMLIVHLILVFAVAGRKHSAALFASMLGVSAVADILVCSMVLIGLRTSVMPVHWVEPLVELIWMVVMLAIFSKAPPAVRKKGYRLSHYSNSLGY